MSEKKIINVEIELHDKIESVVCEWLEWPCFGWNYCTSWMAPVTEEECLKCKEELRKDEL